MNYFHREKKDDYHRIKWRVSPRQFRKKIKKAKIRDTILSRIFAFQLRFNLSDSDSRGLLRK